MTANTGVCRTWSETPKSGFLASRLIKCVLFLTIYELIYVPPNVCHYVFIYLFIYLFIYCTIYVLSIIYEFLHIMFTHTTHLIKCYRSQQDITPTSDISFMNFFAICILLLHPPCHVKSLLYHILMMFVYTDLE